MLGDNLPGDPDICPVSMPNSRPGLLLRMPLPHRLHRQLNRPLHKYQVIVEYIRNHLILHHRLNEAQFQHLLIQVTHNGKARVPD